MLEENALIIKTAFSVASKIRAKTIAIHTDPLDDLSFSGRISKKAKVILISKKKKLNGGGTGTQSLAKLATSHIVLPKIHITRIGLIKVATTLALSQELIEPGDKIVFVVGQSDTGVLDMLHVVDTGKESEIITGRGLTELAEAIRPELFQAVLNLAVELADKGREGKPIGTIFVLGDHEKVLQLSKQMIMNPFKGYEEDERNILLSSLKETIREFSAMDGAFIISDEGTLLTAGRYLGAAMEESQLPRGLGSRHIAAAGITALTKSIAFVISESSGDVRIFKDGKIIMNIEKAPAKK
jgi:DNA integrity scanning protein DisA with diadenylate cyclase activity